ncbi:hypothetical protein ACM66B_003557 [Microbotryomycetes sp. NB124-2]
MSNKHSGAPVLSTEEQLAQAAQALDALRHQAHLLQVENEQLCQRENEQLRQQAVAAEVTVPAPQLVQITKETSPFQRPSTFDGKDKSKFSSFISQCKFYISAVPHQFKTDTVKVSFVISLLRDNAYKAFEPYLELPSDKRPAILDDFELFLKRAEQYLGDPDRAHTMTQRLKTLRQTGSATDYSSTFFQTAAFLNWNDEPLQAQFYDGLKPEVQSLLALLDAHSTVQELSASAIRIDNRLHQQRQLARSKNNNICHSLPLPVASQPRPAFNQTRPALNAPVPMDLDATSQPRGPLTSKEREQRKDEGLCFYYGPRSSCQDEDSQLATGTLTPDNLSLSSTLGVQPHDHLVIPFELDLDKDSRLAGACLIDCGATSVFVNSCFVDHHNIPCLEHPAPIPLFVIDGRPIASGNVTHFVNLDLVIGGHIQHVQANVTALGHSTLEQTRIIGLPLVQQTPGDALDAAFASPADFVKLLRSRSAITCFGLLSYGTLLHASATNEASQSVFPQPLPPDSPEYLDDLRSLLPADYYDLLAAFWKTGADSLPPHWPFDLAIDLEDGKQPPFGPLYSLSEKELAALSSWLDENPSCPVAGSIPAGGKGN